MRSAMQPSLNLYQPRFKFESRDPIIRQREKCMSSSLTPGQFYYHSILFVCAVNVLSAAIWLVGFPSIEAGRAFFQTLSLPLFLLTAFVGSVLLIREKLAMVYWTIPLMGLIAAIEEFAWIIILCGQPLVVFGEEHYNLHDFFGTAYMLIRTTELSCERVMLMAGVMLSGSVVCCTRLKALFFGHRPLWLICLAGCCIVLAQIGDALAESDGLKGQSQGAIGMMVEELLENTGALLFFFSALALRHEGRT